MPDFAFKVKLSEVSARQLSPNVPRSPNAVPFYRLDFNGKVIQSDVHTTPGDPQWPHTSNFEYRLSESSTDALLHSLAARHAVLHVLFLEPDSGKEVLVGSCSVDLLTLATGAARCAYDLRLDSVALSAQGRNGIDSTNGNATMMRSQPITGGAVNGKVEFTLAMEQQSTISIELQNVSVSPMPRVSPYKISYTLLSTGGAHEVESNVVSATADPTWDAQLMPRLLSRATLKDLLADTLRVTIRDVGEKGSPAVGRFDIVFSDIINTHVAHTAQFRRNAYAVGASEANTVAGRQAMAAAKGGGDGLVQSFQQQSGGGGAVGAVSSSWGALVTGSVKFSEMPYLAQLSGQNSSNINGVVHGRPLLKSCMVPSSLSKYPTPAASAMMLANTSRATNQTFIANGGVPAAATQFHNDLYGPPTVPMSGASGAGAVSIGGQTVPIGMNLSNMTVGTHQTQSQQYQQMQQSQGLQQQHHHLSSVAPVPGGPYADLSQPPSVGQVGFFPTSPKRVDEVGGAAGGTSIGAAAFNSGGTSAPMSAEALRAQLQQMEERKAKFNIAPPPLPSAGGAGMGGGGMGSSSIAAAGRNNGGGGPVTVTHHHHYGGGRGGAVAAAAAASAASSLNTSAVENRYKSPPRHANNNNNTMTAAADPSSFQQHNNQQSAHTSLRQQQQEALQHELEYSKMVDPLFRVNSRRGSMAMRGGGGGGAQQQQPTYESRFESPNRHNRGGGGASAAAASASVGVSTVAPPLPPSHYATVAAAGGGGPLMVSSAAANSAVLPRHVSPPRGGMAANAGAPPSHAAQQHHLLNTSTSRPLSPAFAAAADRSSRPQSPFAQREQEQLSLSQSQSQSHHSGISSRAVGPILNNPITASGQALVDQYKEAVTAIETQLARVAAMAQRLEEQTLQDEEAERRALSLLAKEDEGLRFDIGKAGRVTAEIRAAQEALVTEDHKCRLEADTADNGILNALDDANRTESELLALLERVHASLAADEAAKAAAREERERARARLEVTSREYNALSNKVRAQSIARSPLRSLSPNRSSSAAAVGASSSFASHHHRPSAALSSSYASPTYASSTSHYGGGAGALTTTTAGDQRAYETHSQSLALRSAAAPAVVSPTRAGGSRSRALSASQSHRYVSPHDSSSVAAITAAAAVRGGGASSRAVSPPRDRSLRPLDVRHFNPTSSSLSSTVVVGSPTYHNPHHHPSGGGLPSYVNSSQLHRDPFESRPSSGGRSGGLATPHRGRGGGVESSAVSPPRRGGGRSISGGGGGSSSGNYTQEAPTLLPPLRVVESRALSPNSERAKERERRQQRIEAEGMAVPPSSTSSASTYGNGGSQSLALSSSHHRHSSPSRRGGGGSGFGDESLANAHPSVGSIGISSVPHASRGGGSDDYNHSSNSYNDRSNTNGNGGRISDNHSYVGNTRTYENSTGMAATLALDTRDMAKAIETSNVPLFRSILSQNPDVIYSNNSWLHAACAVARPSYEIVSAIVTMRPELVHAVDAATGNVPLHFLCAATEPSVKVADCLLSAGGGSGAVAYSGPVTVHNKDGLTPFHVAVLNANDAVPASETSGPISLKQFLAKRCGKEALNAKTSKGESAAHLCAISDKYLPALKFLFKSGASCGDSAIVMGAANASIAVTPLEKARMYGSVTSEVQRYLQHVVGH